MRQYGGIEAHRVFYQKYGLHTHLFYIFFGIHPVFQKFYYRQDKVYIAKPGKHIIDTRQIFVGQTAAYLFAKRGEYDKRYVRI